MQVFSRVPWQIFPLVFAPRDDSNAPIQKQTDFCCLRKIPKEWLSVKKPLVKNYQ